MSKQIKGGVLLSYASTFINLCAAVIVTPITLRLFGQSEFGLYSLAMSVMGILFLFDFGLSNAIVRYVTQFKSQNENKKINNLNGMFLILYSLIGLIAFIVGLIVTFNADKIFSNGLTAEELNRFKLMLLIVSINLAISFPFKIFNGIIIAHERFIFLKSINIIRTIVNPTVTILVLSIGFKSIELLICITIANILFSLLDVYYCLFNLNMKIRLYKFDFKLLREIANYSSWIFIASIVDIIYNKTDMFILGAIVDSSSVAIYAVADSINSIFTQLTMVLSGFFLPKLVKMVTSSATNSDLTNLFIKVSRIQFMLAALVLTGFSLVGSEFIKVWAGEEYWLSFWVAIMVMAIRFIPIVQVLAVSILQAKNKHAFRSIIYLFVAILNILISIPLAIKFGVIGTAIGTVIGIAVNTVIMNFYYSKVGLEMKRYYREVFVLFIPMFFLILFGLLLKKYLEPTSITTIIIFSVIMVIVYGSVMYKFFMNIYEKDIINRLFNKIFKKKKLTNINS